MEINSKIAAQAVFKLVQVIEDKQRSCKKKHYDFLELEIVRLKFVLEVLTGMNTLFEELTKLTDFQKQIIDAIAKQQGEKLFTKPTCNE